MSTAGRATARRRYHPGESAGDERYTRPATVEICARLAGVQRFTLDVAACEASHHAADWFGIAENGLTRSWSGVVWCNPPYSDISAWVTKTWSEMARRDGPDVVAMLLPATRTEQRWWHKHVEPFRDGVFEAVPRVTLRAHFLLARHAFDRPGPVPFPREGKPPFGLVLLVWGRR